MKYSNRGKLDFRRAQTESLRRKIQDDLSFEHLSSCSLCRDACKSSSIVAIRDRYGFPARLALCHQTGLLYLVDRLSEDSYREFYKTGIYRELLAEFWGHQEYIHEDDLHEQAKKDASQVMDALRHQLVLPSSARLLDIGGSTGALANLFIETYGVEATVLDPSENELNLAASLGLKTIAGTIEHANIAGDGFDVIVLHRTIEHVMDLHKSCERIRSLLKPDGFFIFSIVDFLGGVTRFGCAEAVSRLDHCYFLYDEMIDVFCAQIGFKAERRIHYDSDKIIYICKKVIPDQNCTLSESARLNVIRTLITQHVVWQRTPSVFEYSLGERVKSRISNYWRTLRQNQTNTH